MQTGSGAHTPERGFTAEGKSAIPGSRTGQGSVVGPADLACAAATWAGCLVPRTPCVNRAVILAALGPMWLGPRQPAHWEGCLRGWSGGVPAGSRCGGTERRALRVDGAGLRGGPSDPKHWAKRTCRAGRNLLGGRKGRGDVGMGRARLRGSSAENKVPQVRRRAS